jgi:hypothetical protein
MLERIGKKATRKERIEGKLDPPRLNEEDGKTDATDQRQHQRDQGDLGGDPQRRRKRAPVRDEGIGDGDWAGKYVGRNAGELHIDVPDQNKYCDDDERHGDAQGQISALGSFRVAVRQRRGGGGLDAHRSSFAALIAPISEWETVSQAWRYSSEVRK